MKLIKMRFDNDCSIASVATATRTPYSKCLKVAKENGFIPYGKNGFDVGKLLFLLNFEFKVKVTRLILIPSPLIVSIPSLNNRGGFHAIVVHNGKVLDPSNKKTANFDYVLRNYRLSYRGFKSDE